MNCAGVNATTNMTMECSIFYFRRPKPPLPLSVLSARVDSRVSLALCPCHYLFRFIPGFPPKFALGDQRAIEGEELIQQHERERAGRSRQLRDAALLWAGGRTRR